MDRLLNGEYTLGEPWKLPKAAGFIIPIIGAQPFTPRNYLLLQETMDNVEFRDTGSISRLEALNKSGANVLIRKGTLLKGLGTQSRSPVIDYVLEPIKQYVPVTVNCIHASHGISRGAAFKAEGVAPQSIYQSLGEQSRTWASIGKYTTNLKSSRRRAAPEAEGLNLIAEDNLVETRRAVRDMGDTVEDALKGIPGDHLDQIGVAVFDLSGVVAVELFEHPDSWHAFSKSIVRSYEEVLTEEVSDLIEVRTDRAGEVLMSFLREAREAEPTLIHENRVSKLWSIRTEHTDGQVTEVEGVEVHLTLGKPGSNEPYREGYGVQVQMAEPPAPSPPWENADAEPPEETEEFIQKKGGFNLLEQLARTPQRFSDLVQEGFVSRRTLSSRIKEAEGLGLVEKGIRKSNGAPSYVLTDTGEQVKKKSEEKAK